MQASFIIKRNLSLKAAMPDSAFEKQTFYAGPLFTQEDQIIYKCFIKHLSKDKRAILSFSNMLPAKLDLRTRLSLQLALDLHGMFQKCDSVLVNLNGRVPDSYCVWLAALAYACNRRPVLYKADHRSKLFGQNNSMVSGAGSFEIIQELKKVSRKIAKVVPDNIQSSQHYAPLIEGLFKIGAQIYSLLIPITGPDNKNKSITNKLKKHSQSVLDLLALWSGQSIKQARIYEKEQRNSGRVYCSGPLFNHAELVLMKSISSTLEGAGYETFLPQRDGLEAFGMNSINNSVLNSYPFRLFQPIMHRAVFRLDVFEVIKTCDIFLINLNGILPDEGALVEWALAIAAGKPVIIYCNDARRNQLNSPLDLLAENCISVCSLEELANSIGAIQNTSGEFLLQAEKRSPLEMDLKYSARIVKWAKRLQFLKGKNRMWNP